MPHYCDGTEAHIGDVVCGVGYNIKDPICGVVVGLVPDSESCNIRVAYLEVPKLFELSGTEVVGMPCGVSGGATCIANNSPVRVSVEYGEVRNFELLKSRMCAEISGPIENIF